MSINAIVQRVERETDGSGTLYLTGEERGQNKLKFAAAPADVDCLTGKQVWGSADRLLYGQTTIAKRLGYTRIEFVVGDSLATVIAEDNRRRAAQRVSLLHTEI